MNKKLLTAATLAVFASAAHAQSSVTLYGVIDEGISYVNNSKTATGHDNLVKYDDGEEVTYPIMKFVRSNAGTCLNQRPLVSRGDHVKYGDTLIDYNKKRTGLMVGVSLVDF